MPLTMRLLVLVALLPILAAAAAAQEASDGSTAAAPSLADTDFADQLPRIDPVEPADALATFTVAPGFRVEQLAAEPLVTDPVAMAFDERGRLYVVQMNDYSEQSEDFLGQVCVLEDTDGDGRYDRTSVLIDKLSWPTAVICCDGGVLIGAAPDIIYAKDTDGDGKADVRRRLYTGFDRSNVQGLLNTLQWGLDNRIHGATSTATSKISYVERPGEPALSVRGRDFAIDPRTWNIAVTSGGGQHGMSFDDWGHKFVCSNSSHAQQIVYDERYLARNPYLSAPSPRIPIAADGPQAEVYRTSPVEPWRVIRTELRKAGIVRGAVEGGGRAAGYFTGATGITIYRGTAWPADAYGLLIVGDVGSNLVHRKRLETNGLEFIARRIDVESELLSSSDIWFRPAQYANAPDGSLYIADMYREVIEHPKSLPLVIKQHLDLTSGRDRGRIYRLVPENYQQPAIPRLDQASTAELVALLEHANAWHRETAARLLYERQDKAAIEPLEKLAAASASPLGRLHALYALDGLGALGAATLLPRLDDEHAQVRRHAVRLAEQHLGESKLVERLLAMGDDADLEVRFQVAFTLGELEHDQRDAALAAILRRHADDKWMRTAVFSSLHRGAADVLSTLAADAQFRDQPAAPEVLEQLAVLISLQNDRQQIATALAALEQLPDSAGKHVHALVRGLTAGMSRSNSHLHAAASSSGGRLHEALQSMLAAAREQAVDGKLALTARVKAIDTLRFGAFNEVGQVLGSLLDNRQPQEVQSAALRALGRFDDPQVGQHILAAWLTLGPKWRESAATVLLARPERIAALLDAVEAGSFASHDLSPATIQALLAHRDPQIASRANSLLGALRPSERSEVVESYRSALKLTGDLEQGRTHFRKICATCHRVEQTGFEIGPNLVAMKNRGAETILLNVLDPSREVNPEFLSYTVITSDGRTLSGMVASETANSIVLKRAENESDTVLRVDIEHMQSTGKSIMPEGLEKQLDQQALADVIAYLLSVKE